MAVRAELEGERSVTALVELVHELPGADVPDAYDSSVAADRQEVSVGAERDRVGWSTVERGDRRACGRIPDLRGSMV